jgi:hypothetical protein
MQVRNKLLEEHPGYRFTPEHEAWDRTFLSNAGNHPRNYHGGITQRTVIWITIS